VHSCLGQVRQLAGIENPADCRAVAELHCAAQQFQRYLVSKPKLGKKKSAEARDSSSPSWRYLMAAWLISGAR